MSSNNQPLTGQEHQVIDELSRPDTGQPDADPPDADPSDDLQHIQRWLRKKLNPQCKEHLGLHHTKNGIAPGNFVGAVWLGEKGEGRIALIVCSKFRKMNYLQMYLDCAEHPVVRGRLGECFEFWPDKTPIEAAELPRPSELLIAAFLRELHELCTRHLRRHFQSETANLMGKVKGKLLPHQHLRHNLSCGRQDRMYCTYQTIHNDILENRVLRAALEQSAKFVHSRPALRGDPKKGEDPKTVLARWIHASRAALSDVPVDRIRRSDLNHLRMRGTFGHYRKALVLAKYILRRLGTDPKNTQTEQTATPPFAIDSARLFQCYTETVLRRQDPYRDLEVESNCAGDRGGFTVRPDFCAAKLDTEPAAILDAKYKEFTDGAEQESTDEHKGDRPSAADAYQMIAYSRHRNLLKALKCGPDDEIDLILLYPAFNDGSEAIAYGKTDNSFHAPLKVALVNCPSLGELPEHKLTPETTA